MASDVVRSYQPNVNYNKLKPKNYMKIKITDTTLRKGMLKTAVNNALLFLLYNIRVNTKQVGFRICEKTSVSF